MGTGSESQYIHSLVKTNMLAWTYGWIHVKREDGRRHAQMSRDKGKERQLRQMFNAMVTTYSHA